MNDSQQETIAILNQLHAAEMNSLLPRLLEMNLSVSMAAAPVLELGKKIAKAAREHRELLVDTIADHHSTVWPVSLDLSTGSLHYVSLDSVLPLLTTTLEKLVAAYAEATQKRSLTPEALEVISLIHQHYAEFLKQLQSISSGFVPSSIR